MSATVASYGWFSQAVQREATGRRVPLQGAIEVAYRCNLSCAHCYNNLPVGDQAARAAELTLAEYRRVLDEITQAGCLWLLFTGGEIFSRPDFLDIYDHARRNGLIVTLFTNGTMITPAIADRLAASPPFKIEVTLYGRTRETYERVTGVPGSYDRCLRGIDLLLARGLPVQLKGVALSLNRHEIRSMQRFAEEKVGKVFKFDAMMTPRIDCSHSPLAVRLSPEEVTALDLEDGRRVAGWIDLARRLHRPAREPDRLYQCGAGDKGFSIDPYGFLTMCTLSHQHKFDLRKGSFQEGWERFLGAQRARKITRITKCVGCQIRAMCGMCPAASELHGDGDPERPIDFYCETAHLRAYAIGLEVPAHGACEFCPGGERHSAVRATAERLRLQAGDGSGGRPATGPGAKHLPVLRDQGESAGCGCDPAGGMG